MIDYVYPNGNEDKFIEVAEKLGVKTLVFIYSVDNKNNNKKNEKFKGNDKVSVQHASEVLKIGKSSGFTFYRGYELRHIIGSPKINVVIGCENSPKFDKMHYRESGFNHVMAKIAKEKGKSVAFSFSELLDLKPAKRSIILGRMKQNIKLCKKYGVKMIFGSFAKNPMYMRTDYDKLFK